MKELFIVAQNAFSVSVPDGLAAWEALKPRYGVFAAREAARPVLEVEVLVGRMPRRAAEVIYEPEHAGIGAITSRASRLGDGSLAVEFMHIDDPTTRLWLTMPPELDRAEIRIAPDGYENDEYFLTHALMIAYMLATSGNGTLLIHSAAVINDGRAYLFQGKSGTGKSTHARLWTRHVAGTELLNDDHPVIRFTADGLATAYGTPWSGKTHCYRDAAAPVGAFVRIVRGEENELRRLAPLRAFASLTSSVFFMPFVSDSLREKRHRAIERLAASVPCYEMHCRPDAAAALTCHQGVGSLGV